MKTLKVMTRVRVEGWVEVSRQVPDDFDPNNIDVAGSIEDDLVEGLAATATHSVAVRVIGCRSKTLEVRTEVTP